MIERADPPFFERLVADSRNDQQVARARGGHVRQAHAFGGFARPLVILVIEQVLRHQARDAHRAAASFDVEIARRLAAAQACAVMSASTTTGNSRPLALCTVISRTPSLPSSRIGASGASARLGGLAQLLDESAERQPAVGLVPPRQLGDVQHVGQHLLAAAPQHEGRRARGSRRADVVIVSATGRWLRRDAARASTLQRLGDRRRCAGRFFGHTEGMERVRT